MSEPGTVRDRTIAEGDNVIFRLLPRPADQGRPPNSYLLKVGEFMTFGDRGSFDTSKLIGMEYGAVIDHPFGRGQLLRPRPPHVLEVLQRGPQITLEKDQAPILYHAGISSGDLVVEGGTGSGFLTTALAWTVAPSGKVVTFERKERHQDIARRNVEKAGLADVVEFRSGDIADASGAITDADVLVVDIPEPWELVDVARSILARDGRFVALVPTYTQAERTMRTFEEAGYLVEAFEASLRHLELSKSDEGIRPAFRSLDHSEIIVMARKLDEE